MGELLHPQPPPSLCRTRDIAGQTLLLSLTLSLSLLRSVYWREGQVVENNDSSAQSSTEPYQSALDVRQGTDELNIISSLSFLLAYFLFLLAFPHFCLYLCLLNKRVTACFV